MIRLSRRQTLSMIALGSALPASLHAQSPAWPARPIRIVVPFPPGGATDISARLIAEHLSRRLGQSAVVENRPGGSTVIGVDAVAKAPADGYTLLVAGGGSYSVLPALRRDLPFDIGRDFTPVSLIASAPVVVVAPASSPHRSLAELISAARAQPGRLRYASYGPGSAPHLAAEMLNHAAGIDLQPIAYKGASETSLALLRGEVDLGFETFAASNAMIKADKLRVLAHNGAQRTSFLPDTPGMKELGLEQAANEAFYGMMAPTGTPTDIVGRLSSEIASILALPEVRERLTALFLESTPPGPQAMSAMIQREFIKYQAVVQRARIQPQS